MSSISISAVDQLGYSWHCTFSAFTKKWSVHLIDPAPSNGCKEIGTFRSSFALIRSPLIPPSARTTIQELLDDAQLIIGIREPLTKG